MLLVIGLLRLEIRWFNLLRDFLLFTLKYFFFKKSFFNDNLLLILNLDCLFLGTAIIKITYSIIFKVLLILKLRSGLVGVSTFTLPKLLEDVMLNIDELRLVFIRRVRII